eukprot:1681699-Pyramimonas_sp.AAC.1
MRIYLNFLRLIGPKGASAKQLLGRIELSNSPLAAWLNRGGGPGWCPASDWSVVRIYPRFL